MLWLSVLETCSRLSLPRLLGQSPCSSCVGHGRSGEYGAFRLNPAGACVQEGMEAAHRETTGVGKQRGSEAQICHVLVGHL